MNPSVKQGLCAICLLLLIRFSAFAGTPVVDIAFHPTEPIAVWNGDDALMVHSMDNSIPNRKIPIDPPKTGMFRIRSVSFHPNGKSLAIAGGSPGTIGSLLILNWPTGEIIRHQSLGEEWLTCVAFSKSGSQLAVGSGDSDIIVFDVIENIDSIKQSHTLPGHAGSVMDTLFDNSGKWLVSTGSDRSVKLWDLETGDLHSTFAHHTGMVLSASLRPSFPETDEIPFYVATASADQTVRVWQPEIGRMVRIIRKHNTDLFAVAYHPSGNWMASAGKDGVIRYLDANSDQILHSMKAHEDWIYALSFSPNGKWLASGDWQGKVRFHDVASGPSAVTTIQTP